MDDAELLLMIWWFFFLELRQRMHPQNRWMARNMRRSEVQHLTKQNIFVRNLWCRKTASNSRDLERQSGSSSTTTIGRGHKHVRRYPKPLVPHNWKQLSIVIKTKVLVPQPKARAPSWSRDQDISFNYHKDLCYTRCNDSHHRFSFKLFVHPLCCR